MLGKKIYGMKWHRMMSLINFFMDLIIVLLSIFMTWDDIRPTLEKEHVSTRPGANHIPMRRQAQKYIDDDGYLRYSNTDYLVHRHVAYKYLYKKGNYPKPFGAYVVHHKDLNKRNNHHSNLEILTKEEHAQRHPHLQKE
jgi:ABC-type nickel/cobalt efflux system permease component RcnA